jgi:phosphatidylserine/phosphatidylglycerophosphate/cardiolipin synthase-like enzyme
MTDTNSHAPSTFLRGPDVEHKAKEMISQAPGVWAAVAYWGSGSFDCLDFKDLKDRRRKHGVSPDGVTIVCDLMSGACNPTEIERLQAALGKSHVLMRDRLHAKVWWTDRGAIVGSSNMSANGLGFEGNELRESIEANVFVDNDETLAAINRWFEKDVMKGAKEITKADIKEACHRHKYHRSTRPTISWEGSFLDAIREHTSSFVDRDLLVWAYEDGSTPSAMRALKA